MRSAYAECLHATFIGGCIAEPLEGRKKIRTHPVVALAVGDEPKAAPSGTRVIPVRCARDRKAVRRDAADELRNDFGVEVSVGRILAPG